MRTTIAFIAWLALAASTTPAWAQPSNASKPPVVAVFALNGPITEKPSGDGPLMSAPGESLKDLIKRLHKARDDEAVKGVVLMLQNASMGLSQMEEIRRAMDEIKNAGKTIHVHSDSLSMGSYVLLSGASELTLVPTGDLFIQGIYAEQMYLRDMLDKIGVQPDYVAIGDYKSAGEMFMRSAPSEAAQENIDWLIDGIFQRMLELIAEGRQVSVAQAKSWIDQGLFSADSAEQAGIIDGQQYRQDFLASLKQTYGEDVRFDKRYGKKKAKDVDLSSPFGLLKMYADLLAGPKRGGPSKDVVAIVYVEGPIVPGKPDSNPFALSNAAIAYSDPIRAALDKVAQDEHVKAVVLRVNSPGGSVVASEIILNATKRVLANKPLVVSMGDVAGSGGYYVACGTDTIFADATTITGSIGVVAGKFATQQMWDKIGVSWSPVQRGANAALLSSAQVFSEQERNTLTQWMEEVYQVFKGHVIAARGDRLQRDIDALAGGRVYTGQQALELGLIDQIGGLDDAIRFVANRAGIEDYDVQAVPRPKTFVELLVSELQGGDGDSETISLDLGQKLMAKGSLLATLTPLLQQMEPQRLQALIAALVQMQILQQEGVTLSMPIVNIRI